MLEATYINGHPNSERRRMKSCSYVLDVVRSMYAWAADPQRGHLLPADFINPFRHAKEARTGLVGEPDITISMAVDFLRACDEYQMRLFAPLLFYGLRASEPCMLFYERVQDGWLKVQCLPSLEYVTKGQRDKWLPLFPAIENLLNVGNLATGLI